jgi:hypothetical protein
MRVHGIDKVTVEYCGSGDSGGIEEIMFEDNMRSCVKCPGDVLSFTVFSSYFQGGESLGWVHKEELKQIPFRDALEQHCYDLIDSEHSGWENDDGGSGTFTFDVESGKISWEHHSYYTETNTDNYEV